MDLVANTEQFVRNEILGDPGHDWSHITRVRNLARCIAEEEGADLLVVELAALLHDLDDVKFTDGDGEPHRARAFLQEQGADSYLIDGVVAVIAHVSFKGAGTETRPATKEGAVVQDADRLDAMGAIGIARAFSFDGLKGRPFYDPAVPPVLHTDAAAYKTRNSPTINHFYEKLFLLKDRMNTAAGKRLAGERHAYMESYVRRFLDEWEGKK